MKKIVTCEQMRSLERAAFDRGIPGLDMMEEAARAVADAALAHGGEGRFAVVCGGGNNGGDGLAAARMLMDAGREVDVLILTDPASLRGDAATNYRRLSEREPSYVDLSAFARGEYTLIVDAILGIGLEKRPLRDAQTDAIRAIASHRERGSFVLAVDIPSGVLGDTGEVTDPCVCADATVTFGFRKPGHLLFPGRALCGRVTVAGLTGVEPSENPAFVLADADAVERVFPARPMNSHKGTYGHVLVLAGSRGMMGAAAIASTAALKTGAGLVSWGYPRSETPTAPWTVMARPLSEIDGMLDGMAIHDALEMASRCTSLAMGPGLGRSHQTRAFVRGMLDRCGLPVVLDADGIFAMRGHPEWLSSRKDAVMTPHPGEMAAFLDIPVADVVADPVGIALRASEATGWTVLLKGATTVIASPGMETALCIAGNPGMATAGSGDMLTGIIASLMAQGLSGYDAAWAGAWIHGHAGGLAARRLGLAGITAMDMLEDLPRALPCRDWIEEI